MDRNQQRRSRERYIGIAIGLCILAVAAADEPRTRDTAPCTTDTECMALCPPDDAECDGGPQS